MESLALVDFASFWDLVSHWVAYNTFLHNFLPLKWWVWFIFIFQDRKIFHMYIVCSTWHLFLSDGYTIDIRNGTIIFWWAVSIIENYDIPLLFFFFIKANNIFNNIKYTVQWYIKPKGKCFQRPKKTSTWFFDWGRTIKCFIFNFLHEVLCFWLWFEVLCFETYKGSFGGWNLVSHLANSFSVYYCFYRIARTKCW